MTEGWSGDDYLVIFSAEEAEFAAERYGIGALLPGYRLLGLRGWDDFIVQDRNGATFAIPTVPCDAKDLASFRVPGGTELTPDDRFVGKVKWYITPVAFGGDPTVKENITWIPLAQHADAVRWWNGRYRDLKANQAPTR